jgi:hypothetical protein
LKNKIIITTVVLVVLIAAAAALIIVGSLIPVALAASTSEAWQAGYNDAYYNTYSGHMKPQKSHSQAYIDGFEAGLAAIGQPVQPRSPAPGGQQGYSLTVNVPSHPFGESSVNIQIRTENGYTQSVNVGTAGGTSYTFNIPADQGNSVQVCVYTGFGIVRGQNCRTWTANGNDITVNQSAP